MGEISSEPGYHAQKHLFPIGFRSERQYTSCSDPNDRAVYTSEILAGPTGPIYRVTHEGGDPCFEEKTSSAAWLQVLKEVMINL